MPGSRLEILEGVRHFPQSEDPERFVEVLVDFMTTTEPISGGSTSLHDLLVDGAG